MERVQSCLRSNAALTWDTASGRRKTAPIIVDGSRTANGTGRRTRHGSPVKSFNIDAVCRYRRRFWLPGCRAVLCRPVPFTVLLPSTIMGAVFRLPLAVSHVKAALIIYTIELLYCKCGLVVFTAITRGSNILLVSILAV